MNATASSRTEELLRHTLDFCNESIERGDFAGAHQALCRAAGLSPDDPDILSHRGRLALFLKDHASACQDFNDALKLNSRCAPAHSGLARFHWEQGAFSNAEASAKRALAIHPADEVAAEVLVALREQKEKSGLSAAAPAIAPDSRNHALPASPVTNGTIAARTAVPARGAAAATPAATPEASLEALEDFHARATDYFADVEPPQLTERQLRNSRVLPIRDDILPLMPKGGVCAEVGTQTGSFAKQIFSVLKPAKLHIYDIDFAPFDRAWFQSAIQQGIVQLHQGDSSALLATLPDRYFDFIYIDADHSYPGVVRDLEQAARKIKDDGWIVCNDYTLYSPLEGSKYGVYRAVNEFCLKHDFEICYLALQRWAYHDVALRKRQSPQRNGHVSTDALNGAAPTPATPAAAVSSSGTTPASASTPQADASVRKLAQYVGDDWKQQPYYDDAEQYMDKQWQETIWPFIQEADFSCVLDLAAGHGRNSEKLKQHARRIFVVDINQENIDFCQKRFAGDPRFVFLRNDGCSLAAIPAGGISLVYCFDAMVHFDSDVVRAYLREFARVLRPGGLGFCHHSNFTQNPGGDVHKNPGWRNFMSEALFAHYCVREGLQVVKSRVIDWNTPGSDCVTLFRKP